MPRLPSRREMVLGKLCAMAVETAAELPMELLEADLSMEIIIVGAEFHDRLQAKLEELRAELGLVQFDRAKPHQVN